MFDVEQYLTLTETADNKQTKIAAFYLSGVPKTWYINTYGNKNTVTSLEDFLKAFKSFFLSATETQDVYSVEISRTFDEASSEFSHHQSS